MARSYAEGEEEPAATGDSTGRNINSRCLVRLTPNPPCYGVMSAQIARHGVRSQLGLTYCTVLAAYFPRVCVPKLCASLLYIKYSLSVPGRYDEL